MRRLTGHMLRDQPVTWHVTDRRGCPHGRRQAQNPPGQAGAGGPRAAAGCAPGLAAASSSPLVGRFVEAVERELSARSGLEVHHGRAASARSGRRLPRRAQPDGRSWRCGSGSKLFTVLPPDSNEVLAEPGRAGAGGRAPAADCLARSWASWRASAPSTAARRAAASATSCTPRSAPT